MGGGGSNGEAKVLELMEQPARVICPEDRKQNIVTTTIKHREPKTPTLTKRKSTRWTTIDNNDTNEAVESLSTRRTSTKHLSKDTNDTHDAA
jgi:hypothetical protein